METPGHPEPVVTLDELIDLARSTGRKLFVETKHPVRFGGMVEQKLLAALQRHGLARPGDLRDAPVTVISFSGSAVWRVRRNAPGVPAVLLGEASRRLGGGAATAVRAQGIGPSVDSLRERPDTVAKARAAGRFTYCWTVDSRPTWPCATASASSGSPPTTRPAPVPGCGAERGAVSGGAGAPARGALQYPAGHG
ncbi:hypothetical protein MTP03_01260 [Tsukamurella sp. PLM1]|nr:hypothetical protein MTP03_01260 [Tsukamurella sp. PLM1]